MVIRLCVYYFVIVSPFLNILSFFLFVFSFWKREKKSEGEKEKSYVCVFSLTGSTPLTKQLCPWTAFFIFVSDFDFNTLICFFRVYISLLTFPICSSTLPAFTIRALSILIILKIAQVVPLKTF